MQRGGVPTTSDRILTLRMGVNAVQSLVKGESSRLVTLQESIVKTRLLEQSDFKNESYQYYLDMFKNKAMGL